MITSCTSGIPDSVFSPPPTNCYPALMTSATEQRQFGIIVTTLKIDWRMEFFVLSKSKCSQLVQPWTLNLRATYYNTLGFHENQELQRFPFVWVFKFTYFSRWSYYSSNNILICVMGDNITAPVPKNTQGLSVKCSINFQLSPVKHNWQCCQYQVTYSQV